MEHNIFVGYDRMLEALYEGKLPVMALILNGTLSYWCHYEVGRDSLIVRGSQEERTGALLQIMYWTGRMATENWGGRADQ